MTVYRGTAAVLYHPDAYSTDRPDLKGRHSAGAGFLGGMARYLDAPALVGVAPSRAVAEQFIRQVQAAQPGRQARWLPSDRLGLVANLGNFHLPDPSLAKHAWHRRRFGQRSYSITGVTHTICASASLDGMAELLLAPLQSWDAVICTSTAARRVIESVLEQWSDYLFDRLGGTAAARPQLPVIPLGVEAALFAPADAEAQRAHLRGKMGIADDDVAVLFFGRLSFHAKAHPVPMFLALEAAAQRTARKVVLMLTGRFSNDAIATEFRQAMQRWCPSVTAVVVDGADDTDSFASWFAADIFTSLSDNIQETFGLTPVEAMAAGLPVVASDWNGYRDTVVDGETGILVPTSMPAPGPGEVIMDAYADGSLTFDRYIGGISQCTAVDVKACTDAYLRLIEDAGLRQRMGDAGRRRVRDVYDWRVIIAAYQTLWGELDARRRRDEESAPPREGAALHPLRTDPFATFANYPTHTIDGKTRLLLATADPEGALADRLALGMNTYSFPLNCTEGDCRTVLQHLHTVGEATVDAIAGLEPARGMALRRTCAWLLKYDLVTTSRP